MERKAGIFRGGTLLDEFHGETALLEADAMKQTLEHIHGRAGYTIRYLD